MHEVVHAQAFFFFGVELIMISQLLTPDRLLGRSCLEVRGVGERVGGSKHLFGRAMERRSRALVAPTER